MSTSRSRIGVYADFRHGRRAILFDLGDVSALSARELMRVSHVFVSHAHLDHVAGFDRLLRICLHRPEPLHLVGPPGFPDQIEARLRLYTWNLLGAHSIDFRLIVGTFEDVIERDRASSSTPATPSAGVRRHRGLLPPGRVLDEETFAIEAATLDHGIPCLAFALEERLRVNVRRNALERLGLADRTLAERRRSARARCQRPDDTPVVAGRGRTVALGELRREALQVGPGQKIAYATDAVGTDTNAARIVALARDADQLFIEAAFLEEDAAIAARRCHLTAAQAGRIGRAAGARRLVPFHHSARYLARPDALAREAALAFAAAPVPAG